MWLQLYSYVPQFLILHQMYSSMYTEALYAEPKAAVYTLKNNEVPFVAVIRDSVLRHHLCTGTLISKRHIITATSCLGAHKLRSLRAIFRSISHQQAESSTFKISRNLTYQNWCGNTINCILDKATDDISILELDVSNTHIEPAVIRYDLNKPKTLVRVIGWGATELIKRPSWPREGFGILLNKQECEARVKSLIPACLSDVILPDKLLCAISQPAVLGMDGDFGGPVIPLENTISAILIQRCPMYSLADVHNRQINLLLRLEDFRDFITANTQL